MKTIEDSITVDVPVSRAYNQWTQFEEFHLFMEGVKEVKQLDDKRLHWKAEIAGKVKEWDAEIFEQIPDQRMAWRSTGGAKNSGMINFKALGADQTEVNLHLAYDPEGVTENIGDALGVVSSRVAGDLKRFKEFIEKRHATGGWRGEIHGREVRPPENAG
ncbi:MAG: SRPBCC family protein [Undibacterium sp.]|nr:SRPBCC family protein [Opitutaceae bacterium]